MTVKPTNDTTKRLRFILAALIVFAIGAAPVASASTPGYMAGQVVVKFDGDKIAQRELKKITDAEVIGQLEFSPVYLLQYDPGVDPYQEAQKLATKRGVEYAHPNFVCDSSHGVQGSRPISDPPGSGDYKGQPASRVLDLDRVHPAATGNGVRIGIIDGGINFDHPLFESTTFAGYDFVDDDDYAFDEPGGEISGHGTFVAGMLHLVAPHAELIPYRVIDTCGHGDGFTMARAIERAISDSCRLINISLVLTDRHWAVKDVIQYAEEQNIMVVVAAGNDATSADSYPSAEKGALAVAAVDSLYVLADFSNFGKNIDVCAPGIDLYSPYLDTTYAWWSGTSFAAPCVTGQLALLAEIYPMITVEDYQSIIADNCIDLDPYNPGFEDSLGDGLIRSYRALIASGVMAIEDPAMPDDPTVTFGISPTRIECTAYKHQSFPIVEWVSVTSSNAPAVYKAEVLGTQNNFTTLGFATGLTNGLIKVIISADEIYSLGTYMDRASVQVLGSDQAVFLEVQLTVIDPPEALAESENADTLALANYPNPFNPSTNLYFSLPEGSHIRLKVYNILGQEVACLVDRWMSAGRHEITWDGTNTRGEPLSSGMYFYRLETDTWTESRKMMMIK